MTDKLLNWMEPAILIGCFLMFAVATICWLGFLIKGFVEFLREW